MSQELATALTAAFDRFRVKVTSYQSSAEKNGTGLIIQYRGQEYLLPVQGQFSKRSTTQNSM